MLSEARLRRPVVGPETMGRTFPIPDPIPLAEQRGTSFPALVQLMQRLLAPDGCPWDREQDMPSLRRYVLEEACEVIDAIDSGDRPQLADELGDLALQVVFLSELARGEGSFGPDDVIRAIIQKLVRRHPHVFGDLQVSGSDEVMANWEVIKAQEKLRRSLLEGVPRAFPALHRAQLLSERASRVGFDWPDHEGSRNKVDEELAELDQAFQEGHERAQAELGDLLFAVVNLARQRGMDAETCLRLACDRFVNRFAHVERRVDERHGGWPRTENGKPTRGIPLDVLEGYWAEAKKEDP